MDSSVKRLGHPNAQNVLFMLNYGLLMNKSSCSLQDVSFDCSSCKLGKRKVLPFPTQDDITTVMIKGFSSVCFLKV